MSHPAKTVKRRLVDGCLRHAGLVLGGVLVALVLSEVAIRLLQPVPTDDLLPLSYYRGRLRRIANGDTYLRFDGELGWDTMPGSQRSNGGLSYRNNKAGIRSDHEYAVEPAAGMRRLAAFGDSYTYCEDVNLPDCWTTQVEQAWPGTEIVNYGVSGYGPDQAWLRYQRDGTALHPCAVLIGFMTENVNRVVNRFRPFLQPDTGIVMPKPRFLLDGDGLSLLPNPVTDPRQLEDPSWVERTLGPQDRWYFPGMFVPNPLDRLQVVRVVRTAAFRYHFKAEGGEDLSRSYIGQGGAYDSQGEAYQITGRVLIGFANQVRRDGMIPVVVVFSPLNVIETLLSGGAPVHAPLVQWLDRAGIATIDVTDALVEEARRSGPEAVVEAHYTPLGNRVVAAELAHRLPDLVDSRCGG